MMFQVLRIISQRQSNFELESYLSEILPSSMFVRFSTPTLP